MRDSKCLISRVTMVLALLCCIGGCSSGGGGGGNDGDDGITYSGLTEQAEINDLNAEDVTGGAFGAGLIGDDMMGFSLDGSPNETYVEKFRTAKIPVILSDSLYLIDFNSPSAGAFQAAMETVSASIDGNCGGNMSYSVSADNEVGTFNGSFTFSQYCNDGTTINGRARFDGRMNLDTDQFIEAYLSFDNLSGGGLTLDGDIDIDFSSTPDIITFNAYGKDPGTGKVFWIRDYSITIDENAGLTEVEMTGMFYHPDYGYVTLATTSTFVLHDEDEWPTSGSLVVTGAKNSKARITAIDNANCTVEADLDGDDAYEWDSGTIYWDEL